MDSCSTSTQHTQAIAGSIIAPKQVGIVLKIICVDVFRSCRLKQRAPFGVDFAIEPRDVVVPFTLVCTLLPTALPGSKPCNIGTHTLSTTTITLWDFVNSLVAETLVSSVWKQYLEVSYPVSWMTCDRK
jgi:hypothetical protein